MIFLLLGVLLLTAWRFAIVARQRGLTQMFRSVGIAAGCGLLAGVWIGIGARIGMGAITIANRAPQRFTISGTIAVILTFSSLGIMLGIMYEGLLRALLRRKGLVYGGLLTLCTWYSLAHAAAQQLTIRPSIIMLAITSGLLVALIWLPFGFALEALLRKWQDRERLPMVGGQAYSNL